MSGVSRHDYNPYKDDWHSGRALDWYSGDPGFKTWPLQICQKSVLI